MYINQFSHHDYPGKHCYYAHFIHMAQSYLLEVTQIVANQAIWIQGPDS